MKFINQSIEFRKIRIKILKYGQLATWTVFFCKGEMAGPSNLTATIGENYTLRYVAVVCGVEVGTNCGGF